MRTRTFKNLSGDERDRYAWEAMNRWQLYSGIDPIYKGLDFSELTRCFLMNKVARAIRCDSHPENFKLETALEYGLRNSVACRWQHASNTLRQIVQEIRFLALRPSIRSRLENWKQARKMILYVPERPSASLAAVIAALKKLEGVAIADSSFQIPGRGLYKAGLSALSKEDAAFSGQLHQGILNGLREFDIELLKSDQERLSAQLRMQLYHLKIIGRELDRVRPAALLSHNPRTFPGMDYVFLAKQKGIPVFTIQSGLDGDAHVLNNAYGDYVLVYGRARAERYKLHSKFQPAEISICGAPEMDGLRPAPRTAAAGKNWLWILRSHISDKCLLPSYGPSKAIRALQAFLDLLKTDSEPELIIKPHPQGAYLNEFRRIIRSAGMEKRVRISGEKVRTLIPNANLVFSEDTTPGMETMFFGKALIHVHFSDAPPILSFAEYKAALYADSSASLAEAVKKAYALSEAELKITASGQRAFLSDFAGPCDGQAARRMADFIILRLTR